MPLAYMKVVERWGSGIPRLYENCESAGLKEPELSENAGCFRVNMFRKTELARGEAEQKSGKSDISEVKKNRKKEQKKRTEIMERTEKVWKLICKNPSITQAAMMEQLGISRKKVQLALENLIADKRIERVGSDRNGKWKINE